MAMTDAEAPHPLSTASRSILVGSTVVGVILAIVVADLGGLAFFVSFAGTGAYLATQRPRNPIGWLLMLGGWGLLMGTVERTASPAALMAGTLTPVEAVMAWANAIGWAFSFFAFLGITLVFPTGHLPAGRGRWPSRIALGLSVGLAALLSFSPLIGVTPESTGVTIDVPNPIAIAPQAEFWSVLPPSSTMFSLMFALVVVGIVALVVRARAAAGLERLQYRWLIAAIAVSSIANVAWIVQTVILTADRGLVDVVVLFAYVTVPLSIVIAVSRYRLFEIDRIISRTIAYGAVLVVLAGVFAGGVLLLSSVLASSFAQAESIAVAASTLLTYAVLQPVAQRIRRDVDRRFDRTRYDAERTVQAFAVRLRHETNVEAVTRDLASTTQAVVAPTATSLWLRPSR